MARSELEAALADGSSPAHVKRLLAAELARSQAELDHKRSGYEEPVTVAFAAGLAVAPVDAGPDPGGPRARRIADAAAAALREVGDGELAQGEHDGFLALALGDADPELAALAFDEAVEAVDRLRAQALIVPGAVLDVTDLRPVRERTDDGFVIAHDDPDPARRVARRILQRLNGMGKWGGYHTEFAHLARGFHGNEAALALQVGEALLAAELLTQKPSVGQRHVSLNSRRAGEIHRLIEDGELPAGLRLPA